VQHEILIDDKRIVKIVTGACQEIPGSGTLFQYINDEGQRWPHRFRSSE